MTARRAFALALASATALPACERGCVTRRGVEEGLQGLTTGAPGTESPGLGGGGPGGSRRPDLGGTDCSDGLARCTVGRLEVSVLAHLPHPCGSPEKVAGGGCVCPWLEVGVCASGCVVDGLEVLATGDVARTQLCRPLAPIARPALPAELGEVDVCSVQGMSCRGGMLRLCEGGGRPSRVVGACLHGCAAGVGLEEAGEPFPLDGALAILCARPTAERR